MHIGSAKAEIERLAAGGTGIELVMDGAQPYAWVRSIAAPKPPWDRNAYDILIAIPIAYDLGTGLDGFYTGIDAIESHIFHCRGFFLARGAVNARV